MWWRRRRQENFARSAPGWILDDLGPGAERKAERNEIAFRGLLSITSSLVTKLSALGSGLFDPSYVHGAPQGSNACYGWSKAGVSCSEFDLNDSEIALRLLTLEAVLREGGFTQ